MGSPTLPRFRPASSSSSCPLCCVCSAAVCCAPLPACCCGFVRLDFLGSLNDVLNSRPISQQGAGRQKRERRSHKPAFDGTNAAQHPPDLRMCCSCRLHMVCTHCALYLLFGRIVPCRNWLVATICARSQVCAGRVCDPAPPPQRHPAPLEQRDIPAQPGRLALGAAGVGPANGHRHG